MLTLPAECAPTILAFAPLFSKRVWHAAETLLIGAILAPAQRTVTAALRVLGLAEHPQFQNFHRVLNRDRWSPLAGARLLLEQLIDSFVPDGPVLVALDSTLERRRGAKIRAKGVYHDAVRSSRSHFAKSTGLRWLCLLLLCRMPFTQRCWALPVLTALCPSQRYNTSLGRRHKKLTDWGRQLLLEAHRWLPGRTIICVADSGFAALDFLHGLAGVATVITRLRLDAALFQPLGPRTAHTPGRPRLKGAALPKLQNVVTDRRRRWHRLHLARWYAETDRGVEIITNTAVWCHRGQPPVPIRWVLVRDPQKKFRTQAVLSTDLSLTAEEILGYYVERWQVEVTFQESRQYLGIETQRQWSDPAIARTTPVIFGLYSLVALMAVGLYTADQISVRTAAWYVKEQITFSDALAAVRRALWRSRSFATSGVGAQSEQIPRSLYEHLIDTLCYGS